jgi:hypothetical protein
MDRPRARRSIDGAISSPAGRTLIDVLQEPVCQQLAGRYSAARAGRACVDTWNFAIAAQTRDAFSVVAIVSQSAAAILGGAVTAPDSAATSTDAVRAPRSAWFTKDVTIS